MGMVLSNSNRSLSIIFFQIDEEHPVICPHNAEVDPSSPMMLRIWKSKSRIRTWNIETVCQSAKDLVSSKLYMSYGQNG